MIEAKPKAPGFPASVALLTYNQQDYVADAVRSFLAQDCEPIEILISDDSSTDATWDIIQQTVADYTGPHTVRLNRNPRNIGLIAHYNQCFEKTEADIIVIGAGDDVSRPDRVRKTLDAFRLTEAPLLVFSRVELDLLNAPEHRSKCEDVAIFYDGVDLKSACVGRNLYVGATAAYHRDLWRKYGPLPEERTYEDLIMGFRAALEGRVFMIDDALVHYRLGGISTLHLVSDISAKEKSEHRVSEMRKYEIVARQRLEDCRTYGLPSRDPIVRMIRKWHCHLTMRISASERLGVGFVLKNIFSPGELLGALNERRKMMRKKSPK